jgi:PAS domain S-box-containing protein
MKESIIVGLLQNTAILLASTMIYEYIWIKNENSKKVLPKVISGLIMGGISVILMFTPWTWIPGIVFDTRSVLLSITGLFFGPVPTIIAIIISGAARWFLGGDGLWMGLAVIISSGTIGILWRKLRPNWKQRNYIFELLTMGFIVHVIMSMCTFLLPKEDIYLTLKIIALPLVLIYSPATMLLGIVMLNQYKSWQNRLAKLKLKESERRFNRILESGNIVSLLLNQDGGINFCNGYFLQITGYTREEVIGKNWFEMFIPGDMKKKLFNTFLTELHSKNTVKTLENQILSKNGDRLYISWYNVNLHSESNKVNGLASIGVNITDSKNYEQMLEEKNAAIELQNKEYKQINTALQKAKEKAEESDRLKTAFLANMSHEIRTPMNGILGFADLLRMRNLTEQERQEYITIIEDSGKRMLNMINDIISISKIESGITEVHISESNINEQLDYIQTFFTPETRKKGIDLIVKKSFPNDEVAIKTDSEKIYAILINLVNNAIKFTNKGSIEFGYSVMGDNLKFYVKDTGEGISKEHLNLIFDRFRQGSESLTRKYEGTGLGLSISKAYVEMLGGKIWVESKFGKGSVFYFTIPFRKGLDKEEMVKDESNKEDEVKLKNLNILIVEDDYPTEKLLTTYVENYSKNILIACDGKVAVQISKKNPEIDLILMDIKLPEMNGYEATKQIRLFNKEVTIIAQTAFGLAGDKEKALEAGCNEYFSKPISKDALLAAIKSISRNKKE